ncbi:MAG: site-specific DNA-methyltransferase [Treponema sp.]|nr:site-specific DNA-methyltransferase [Treponema sp.]
MMQLSWDDKPELYDDENEVLKLKIYRDQDENQIVPMYLSPDEFERILHSEQHIFVEGDNYPFLKIISGHLENLVDLIYIDPPYNTGNFFSYSDSFSENNDKHSAWLSFMNRRLTLARKILKESGCIFIAIDQSELYQLKLLCDQIFGEENFVNDFMWLHGKGKKDKWSRTLQQHTLCYAKNKKSLNSFCDVEVTDWAKSNPDDDPRGNWFSGSISFTEKRSNPKHKNFYELISPSGKKWNRQWLVPLEEMEMLLATDKIYFGKKPEYDQVPRIKIFNSEETEIIPKNIIDTVESTRSAQRHLDELLGEKQLFDNPKPVDLIEHLIKITRQPKNALIVDFFAGSGTTFEAVESLNKEDGGSRRCILVQTAEDNLRNPEVPISEVCRRRIKKVAENLSLPQPVEFLTLK